MCIVNDNNPGEQLTEVTPPQVEHVTKSKIPLPRIALTFSAVGLVDTVASGSRQLIGGGKSSSDNGARTQNWVTRSVRWLLKTTGGYRGSYRAAAVRDVQIASMHCLRCALSTDTCIGANYVYMQTFNML